MPNLERPNYSSIDLETAVERIRQLEDDAGLNFEVHPHYKLTKTEEALLGMFANSTGVLTKERVLTAIWGMSEDPPNPKIVDVLICKIRKKLKPFGVEIDTYWARGWHMTPENREKVKTMRLEPPRLTAQAAA